MKPIGIWLNTQKDADLKITRRVVDALARHGMAALVYPVEQAHALGYPQMAADRGLLLEHSALMIVLGGDGTLLYIASSCAQHRIPMLGINLGRMGFLSEVPLERIDEAIALLAQNKYYLDERMMLCAHLDCEDAPASVLALNDLVVSRSSFSRMIRIEVSLNGQLIDAVSADGYMISSPTGSTAYSLSAGGPIVDPHHECMLLTPICAHTLRARTIVTSPGDEVMLRVFDPRDDIVLTWDGQAGHPISNGQCIRIRRADVRAHFVRMWPDDFYQRLRSKLSEWSADMQQGSMEGEFR